MADMHDDMYSDMHNDRYIELPQRHAQPPCIRHASQHVYDVHDGIYNSVCDDSSPAGRLCLDRVLCHGVVAYDEEVFINYTL